MKTKEITQSMLDHIREAAHCTGIDRDIYKTLAQADMCMLGSVLLLSGNMNGTDIAQAIYNQICNIYSL